MHIYLSLACVSLFTTAQPLVETCGIECPGELLPEGSATIMGYCHTCPGGVSFDIIVRKNFHHTFLFLSNDIFGTRISGFQYR